MIFLSIIIQSVPLRSSCCCLLLRCISGGKLISRWRAVQCSTEWFLYFWDTVTHIYIRMIYRRCSLVVRRREAASCACTSSFVSRLLVHGGISVSFSRLLFVWVIYGSGRGGRGGGVETVMMSYLCGSAMRWPLLLQLNKEVIIMWIYILFHIYNNSIFSGSCAICLLYFGEKLIRTSFVHDSKYIRWHAQCGG